MKGGAAFIVSYEIHLNYQKTWIYNLIIQFYENSITPFGFGLNQRKKARIASLS